MKEFWQAIIQFIKFAIVGISNTLVSMAVYYLCLSLGLHYILANTVGYVAGTLNAFYWNRKYVFKQTGDGRQEAKRTFMKSFIAYGSTYLLATGLMYLWVDILHISANIAPIINLFITTPLNFLLNKLWAFGPERSAQ